jgi:predicted alpha/beta hydrolase family esterase
LSLCVILRALEDRSFSRFLQEVHMVNQYSDSAGALLIVVRGHDDISARQWEAQWTRRYPDALALELGLWDRPHRNTWVNKLNLAIERAQRPVVVVTQGMAGLALVWWAEYERPASDGPVVGALILDPPDIDRPEHDARLAAFPTTPRVGLPFPAILLATRARGAQSLRSLRRLSRDWGCAFDTVGTLDVLSVPSHRPVETLGQRFLARFMGLAG